jgi:hypothetical protein
MEQNLKKKTLFLGDDDAARAAELKSGATDVATLNNAHNTAAIFRLIHSESLFFRSASELIYSGRQKQPHSPLPE